MIWEIWTKLYTLKTSGGWNVERWRRMSQSSILNFSISVIICSSLLLNYVSMSSTLLDPENFKIDSTTWQVQDMLWVIAGKRLPIKVKINSEGDVREYVRGVPSEFIGQQFFTYTAAHRETQKIGKSLPEDQSALEIAIDNMPGETQYQKYKNYLQKSGMKFSWCFSLWLQVFDDIGLWAYYRLADGSRVAMNSTTRNVVKREDNFGFMISLSE